MTPSDRAEFIAALQYAARFQPVVGDSVAEASQARRVTILGDTPDLSPDIEADLRAAGVVLERIAISDLKAST